ncbi:hypothetical protein PB2503_12684 [Parvularcula bermudensis HTCC2503]|uniref:Tetratricopeptide repeat-like domain-containing protein n=1 Tax=Parvularcula bermudensis (strain ATCC BAA-594 / HTCC2503 / KCTC 12087) TaxID=314260 RepID=E0TFL4_PARBH|nr:tetratricopeptide repeat protein [Parvularcula bermudensis]ADM10574.1 hypothetical protein PB2503_12684 [Parvularcula bermudensis HTCC2503]
MAQEDALLREVDDDLLQDKVMATARRYGPLALGAAAIVTVAVGAFSITQSRGDRAAVERATLFSEAVAAAEQDESAGAAIMLAAADRLDGLYQRMAEMQAAAYLAREGLGAEAATELQAIAADGSLPMRLRDVARLKAGYIMADLDQDVAARLAADVETPAMKGLARELEALILLEQEKYGDAYAALTDLAEGQGAGVTAGLAARARLLAPVADAGRQGVSLSLAASPEQSLLDQLSLPSLPASADPEGGVGPDAADRAE